MTTVLVGIGAFGAGVLVGVLLAALLMGRARQDAEAFTALHPWMSSEEARYRTQAPLTMVWRAPTTTQKEGP